MHPLSLVLTPRFPLRVIVGLLLVGSFLCLTSTDIAFAQTPAPATVAPGADPLNDSVVDATPIYLLKDLNTATASSVIGQMKTLGDAVYFSLYADGAWELWTTNGIASETRKLFRFPATDVYSASIEFIGTIGNHPYSPMSPTTTIGRSGSPTEHRKELHFGGGQISRKLSESLAIRCS